MTNPLDHARLRERISTVSSRAASVFDDVASAVEPLLAAHDFEVWVDLGCAVAIGSAVAAVKMFRESPELLTRVPTERRNLVVRVARELARDQPNLALEFLRQAAPLAERFDDATTEQWGRIAAGIAAQDYDAAIEYVKESASLAGVLPTASFALWGEVGVLLSREDRTVKDFLALKYFRSSADWLRAVSDPALRPPVLALTCHVAAATFPSGATRRPGQVALDVLQYAHTLLGAMPSHETRHALLASGARVAERAPTLVETFLRHAPEVVALVEGSVTRFDEWVAEGLAIADTHRERAEAYFALRSKQATEVAQRLSHGVFLRDIRSALTYVAEALCGRAVEIKSGPGASSSLTERGGVITLPDKITVYATAEDNLRFYRVLTFHEAAHLEFGTYEPVPAEIAAWFGADGSAPAQTDSSTLLGRFPDPGLAQNLWTIAEEARVDFLIRHHYPGLRTDMDRVLGEQLRMRPKIDTLPRRAAILESWLQLSVADVADVPFPVLDPVTHGYDVIKRLRTPEATVVDVLRAVVDLYPLAAENMDEPVPVSSESPPPAEPPSEFDQLAMGHAPIGSFAFRDALQAPQVRMGQHGGRPDQHAPRPPDRTELGDRADTPAATRKLSEGDETTVAATPDHSGSWYPEWDHLADEFKPRWCRVDEQRAREAAPEDIEALLADTRGIEASLRRYFAVMRPEAFRKTMRQPDGDDIDLDAAVAALVERRARVTPDDRLYVRREKRTRDVAVALLIDTSGSTGRQLAGSGRVRRVIDVERESLALVGAALDALGDQFALYAFSGHGRHAVDCRVVKAFDEPFGASTLARISGLTPSGQNRDGAAIRHACHHLRARDAAIKLLILLSDGRPLDDDYAADYALEDTRAALREARALGIHPFCVTVDDRADAYIQRLYGDVQYTIIHDVRALPERLPKIYKRLTI
ncbi:MAG: nitric oxide reductase activation protein NorD [Nitrospirota bacterium]